jgi:hypothetical protein
VRRAGRPQRGHPPRGLRGRRRRQRAPVTRPHGAERG